MCLFIEKGITTLFVIETTYEKWIHVVHAHCWLIAG